MWKRKKNDAFESFKAKVQKKRAGKEEAAGALEYITVQRLSSSVEGKYQKYTRIGALTIVPLACEPTLENIKKACKRHFDAEDLECDVLAGERGPSWTETSQISNWKVIHVRFVERNDDSQMKIVKCDLSSEPGIRNKWKSEASPENRVEPAATKVAASVPLSAMLKVGRLIQPKVDIVSIQLEEFDLGTKSWCQPFEARLSLAREKFASGTFRDAYLATSLSGLTPSNKYVVKKFKSDQVVEVEKSFPSIEAHTRKMVQMNALARNFALKLAADAPLEYEPVLSYTKLYFGRLYEEFVTVEIYLEGRFQKHVNNTGDVCGDGSDLALKAEAFAHYTYHKSGSQLIVLDIQGVGHTLSDPEIATANLTDENDAVLFCCGNLSTAAINTFKENHICNKYCDIFDLPLLQ